ncbi:MAG: hypothetical protein V3U80_05735 [Flavobacteriaceae bacterium]
MLKKKNVLQIIVLLFLATFLFVNCERDEFEKTNSKFSLNKIAHQKVMENQKVEAKIANYKTLVQKEVATNNQARLIYLNDYNFTIDTEKVMYLENNTTGYHS